MLSRGISLPGGVLYTWKPDAFTLDHSTVRGDLALTTGTAGKQVGALRTFTPFGEPLRTDGTIVNGQVAVTAGGHLSSSTGTSSSRSGSRPGFSLPSRQASRAGAFAQGPWR